MKLLTILNVYSSANRLVSKRQDFSTSALLTLGLGNFLLGLGAAQGSIVYLAISLASTLDSSSTVPSTCDNQNYHQGIMVIINFADQIFQNHHHLDTWANRTC